MADTDSPELKEMKKQTRLLADKKVGDAVGMGIAIGFMLGVTGCNMVHNDAGVYFALACPVILGLVFGAISTAINT